MSVKTTGGIAIILTAENIPTPSGKQVWQPTTIESILKNENIKVWQDCKRSLPWIFFLKK